MSASHRESRTRTSRQRRAVGFVAAALVSASLAACEPAGDSESDTTRGPAIDEQTSAPVEPVRVTTSAKDPRAVRIGQPLRVKAVQGTLDAVTVKAADGTRLEGSIKSGEWVLSSRLEPGTDYVAVARARRTDGQVATRTLKLRTEELSLDEQTFPSVAPLAGETVGVGMPVIVSFDVPVSDRAAFEKHMSVSSTPAQPGSWHWLSDNEAHWRPKTYWQAGTNVSIDIDVNSIAAGNGVFGQESRTVDFRVGAANVYEVDARNYQMKVFSNGDLLRTIPITTGKKGFTTRSGTKVIMEKFAKKRMNSETVGISSDDPEAYDIDDVQWAMRLTHSGEFIHAAPWSVRSQGSANVSHGCTGMSTANAGWLYAMSKRGDVVEYTGTDAYMTLDNGYGDWNSAFGDYKTGSALS